MSIRTSGLRAFAVAGLAAASLAAIPASAQPPPPAGFDSNGTLQGVSTQPVPGSAVGVPTPVIGVGAEAGTTRKGAGGKIAVGRKSGVGGGVYQDNANIGAGVGSVVGAGAGVGRDGAGVKVGVAGFGVGLGVGRNGPSLTAGRAPATYVPNQPQQDPNYRGTAVGVGVGPQGLATTAGGVAGGTTMMVGPDGQQMMVQTEVRKSKKKGKKSKKGKKASRRSSDASGVSLSATS